VVKNMNPLNGVQCAHVLQFPVLAPSRSGNTGLDSSMNEFYIVNGL